MTAPGVTRRRALLGKGAASCWVERPESRKAGARKKQSARAQGVGGGVVTRYLITPTMPLPRRILFARLNRAHPVKSQSHVFLLEVERRLRHVAALSRKACLFVGHSLHSQLVPPGGYRRRGRIEPLRVQP